MSSDFVSVIYIIHLFVINKTEVIHVRTLSIMRRDTINFFDFIGEDPNFFSILSESIQGYHAPKAFIAAQSPMSNTVSDFWSLIVSKKVSVVALLCPLWERKKVR